MIGSKGYIERTYFLEFVKYECLRKEYLNQTFNFMPEIRGIHSNLIKNLYFEYGQVSLLYSNHFQIKMRAMVPMTSYGVLSNLVDLINGFWVSQQLRGWDFSENVP